MDAGCVSSSELNDFVDECDRLGGIQSSACAAFVSNFSVRLSTRVDETLDPFSEEYCQQQIAVYRELAGRELNQEEGELTSFELEAHVHGQNPCAMGDVEHMAKHTRSVVTTALAAGLPHNAHILDMGCGWGLSSEILAFCGAKVDAVDINPMFVELVRRRAAHKKLPIRAFSATFDTFTSDDRYDLIMFYECLHHSVRPWQTLAHLAPLLAPGGKIAFSGEPIYAGWWKHWGLRLDALSVYCIRKFGWFESGWSEEFITSAFGRAGLELHLAPGLGVDHSPVGVAHRSGDQVSAPRWDLVRAPSPAFATITPNTAAQPGLRYVYNALGSTGRQRLRRMIGERGWAKLRQRLIANR